MYVYIYICRCIYIHKHTHECMYVYMYTHIRITPRCSLYTHAAWAAADLWRPGLCLSWDRLPDLITGLGSA